MIEKGPFAVMAGCQWNVLDSTGARIAICGGDSNSDWERLGPPIAAAIVKSLNESAECRDHHLWRIAELERLNLEAQHRIADLIVAVGDIEQCRCVEGDSITIICDNPEADDIEKQSAVEACGGYTDYQPQRFYGKTWTDALREAAKASQRFYGD